MNDAIIRDLIESAAPEYAALKAQQAQEAIPSDTQALYRYYADQGIYALAGTYTVDGISEEVAFVDARHCREIEMDNLRLTEQYTELKDSVNDLCRQGIMLASVALVAALWKRSR